MKRILAGCGMALTPGEKKTLLDIARGAIEAAVRKQRRGAVSGDVLTDALTGSGGAFVSLHKAGRLRGCIGMITSNEPLYETVREMAAAAAMRDPRFVPVNASELAALEIEISLLTPLKPLSSVADLEIGRHGLYIIKGRMSGLLLPQVAVEHGFDREEFLDETCLKAGCDPGCWRDNKAMVFTFEAEILAEE